MAKILLINAAGNFTFPHLITPPLGVMYLASVLRQKSPHQVKIVDMRLDYLEPVDVCNEVSRFKPNMVGISNIVSEANTLHQLAKEIKKVSSCKIIAGGPHVTSYPEDGLNDPNINYIVLGEGERTFFELVEAILNGGDVYQVKGIGFRANGDFIKTPPREYIQNLDELPFPAWDLIKFKKYARCWRRRPFQFQKLYMPILTSRGCPYQCTFCYTLMGKRFRARSPENVFSEIEALYRFYSIREFEIIDDAFNIDRERTLNICALIINSGLKINISFPNGIRGDLLNEEILLKLRQAGTYQMSYAIETASPRLQKLIKKNMDLVKLEKVIEKTSRLGITMCGFFMLGLPTETKEEMEKTARFVLRAKLDMYSYSVPNPFPNTKLYHTAERMGKNLNVNFADFTFTSANFNLSKIKDEELFALERKLYRTFYFNPKRIFRIFLRFPNRRMLLFYFIYFLIRAFFGRSQRYQKLLRSLRPL